MEFFVGPLELCGPLGRALLEFGIQRTQGFLRLPPLGDVVNNRVQQMSVLPPIGRDR